MLDRLIGLRPDEQLNEAEKEKVEYWNKIENELVFE